MSHSDSDTDIAVTPAKMEALLCDAQGINWLEFAPTTRDAFRAQRIATYRNYRNESIPHNEIYMDLHRGRKDASLYSFAYTLTRHPFKCSEYHFQLRNLLYSTTNHSVYYSHNDQIRSWDSITKTSKREMVAPFRLSTISARREMLFMGAFTGEFCCKRMDSDLDSDLDVRTGVITNDAMGITNHVELVDDRNGGPIAVISSNDNKVRLMDMNRLQITNEFGFPWATNCSALSPDKRLICVSGDHTDSSIISADSGDEVFTLQGHIDFSFACSWSPCGRYVATGNQDITTRVYDMRNPSKSLVVLPATMGAIRSLRFTEDGAFLAASEPCDFVHIYDFHGTTQNIPYTNSKLPHASKEQQKEPSAGPLGTDAFRSQTIDFFGEVAGISFTPEDGNMLYIGVSDHRYGSILEFERCRSRSDLFLRDVVL
ncbi:WD40-repeat-containing domain protein [Chytriomyces cf. hyalinus JEL632]|nr:WD40-repeat-containing domain protein [Chytriomyces cf. hyalinus JEL632]